MIHTKAKAFSMLSMTYEVDKMKIEVNDAFIPLLKSFIDNVQIRTVSDALNLHLLKTLKTLKPPKPKSKEMKEEPGKS